MTTLSDNANNLLKTKFNNEFGSYFPTPTDVKEIGRKKLNTAIKELIINKIIAWDLEVGVFYLKSNKNHLNANYN